METLKKEKGADWVRVPFKGGGEAVNAVLSGSTPIALIGEGNVIGHIQRRHDDAAGHGQQHQVAEFPRCADR